MQSQNEALKGKNVSTVKTEEAPRCYGAALLRLAQGDNDPKHTCKSSQEWMREKHSNLLYYLKYVAQKIKSNMSVIFNTEIRVVDTNDMCQYHLISEICFS